MAARRFLVTVTVLILLVIAGAFTYRVFAPQLMRAALVPSISFADSPQPQPTFYDRPDAWLVRPGIPSDVVRWTPAGYTPAPMPAVAVFYVHPTTYLSGDRWNAPIRLEGDPRFRQEIFLKSQASVFNGVGEIWAPRYRQATFGAFLALAKPDAGKAFALAYNDVESAFEKFIAEVPPGQPIILAGHSQGSLHLVSLLANRIAGTPVADRIVAAYLIGWPISVEADLPALGLATCTAPDQIHCIISFQSYAEPADPAMILKPFHETVGVTGLPRRDTQTVCTNPLTGGVDEPDPVAIAERSNIVRDAGTSDFEMVAVPADPLGPDRNLGTLVPLDDTFSDAVLEPARVGARCMADGYLSIGENVPKGLGSYVLPGNNYHVYDYALFWTNLRADAERRVETALRRKRGR